MYRTDKQFMKDPTTAHSRIYIGNIAETVVAENLEQKFKVHGKILGLVLQRGFGFIQYQNEFQAKQAIEAEHGSAFFGRKLNVKQAYAQNPIQNAPNKQFNYPPHNNQPPNPQQLPPHQNFERPRPELREPERDATHPGPPQQQQQNTAPQQQPPLQSPQKNQPLQHQNIQQQYSQNDVKKEHPICDDGGGPPGSGPPIIAPPRPGPLMGPTGHESSGAGAPPMVVSGPATGGGGFSAGSGPIVGRGGPAGVGEPPLGPGGLPALGDKPDKRGKKRRRGGGRDRELDRHGLPMDYR